MRFASVLRWQDFLDVTIVSYILYKLFSFIKETRAVQLIRGFLILIIIYFIANYFGLRILTSGLQNAATLVIVAIPVLFQPELRRALSELGRGLSIFPSDRFLKGKELFDLTHLLVACARELSEKKVGALIVLERKIGLNEYIEKGVPLNADVSKELILSIFQTSTPLHDGAIILRANRLMAASVVLPLTDTLKSPAGIYWGTRHRAALGISEMSDSACLVVSEETGSISIILEGKVHRNLTEETLNKHLLEIFQMNELDARENPVTKMLFKESRKTQELREPPKPSVFHKVRQTFGAILFNMRFIAIAIAIIWGLAIWSNGSPSLKPFESYSRQLVLPIQIQGKTEGYVVKVDPKSVQVNITGRGEAMQNIKPEDLMVYINIDDLSTGEQLLPVGVLPPPNVQFKEVSPALVNVKIVKLTP